MSPPLFDQFMDGRIGWVVRRSRVPFDNQAMPFLVPDQFEGPYRCVGRRYYAVEQIEKMGGHPLDRLTIEQVRAVLD